MKSKVQGIKELSKLQKQTELWDKEVNNLDGKVVDLEQEAPFVSGPILHQGSDQMAEEESAQFEIDHPDLIAFLQSLVQKLDIMLAG